MLPKMPGRLGGVAQRIGAAASAAKPALGSKGKQMDVLKKKIAPLKQRSAPLNAPASMPLKGGLSAPAKKIKMPAGKLKTNTPEWMKPGYSPGSIMKGYTKYAKGGKSDTQNA